MRQKTGFTLIELLVVVAIIGLFSTIVFAFVNGARDDAYFARTKEEFHQLQIAIQLYVSDNDGNMPADVNRNLPPGLEAYLASGDWPLAPWPGSVYDWDNWTVSGTEEKIYQISVRFCPQGGPLSACDFPDETWAESFGINSSVYYCIEGPCRSHIGELCSYPGYCINCSNNESLCS